MVSNLLLVMAIILLGGLLMGKVAKRFNIPSVTAYLLTGLLVGPAIPSLFGIVNGGLISSEAIGQLRIIADIELGFIAFMIGTEFRISYFKRVGARPVIIAFAESFFALVFVAVPTYFLTQDLPFALVLGAISAATAPAATIMVIRQFKARGELAETLMSVVAIDDASTLIFFGFATTAAITLIDGGSSSNLAWSIAKPFVEVAGSLVIGVLVGIVLVLLVRWFTGRGNRTSIVLAVVFLISGLFQIIIAEYEFNLSPLLALMATGAVFTNFSDHAEVVMSLVDRIMPPIIVLFFVLSGADLDLSKLGVIGVVGIAYIVFRFAGKWVGAYLGGVVSNAPQKVKKLLGFGLLPQGGVAIGLSMIATAILPIEQAQEIRTIVLAASLFCDFVGPLLTKYALLKSGEGILPTAQ